MNPDSSDTTLTATTVLTYVVMMPVCFAVVIGLCLRLAEQLEPTVGDIADFSRSHASQDVLAVSVTANAAGRTCVLASDAMVRGGGSFVVVARQPSGEGAYLIHWVGAHTSSGASDCGSSADLLVSKHDLLGLAETVGGFGVHPGGSRA